MELIAASRIVRAQNRVAAARPYIAQLTEVIRNLSKAGAGLNQPLLVPRQDVKTVAFVVAPADPGMAGVHNATVERTSEHAIAREQAAGHDYRLIVTGKKGQ